MSSKHTPGPWLKSMLRPNRKSSARIVRESDGTVIADIPIDSPNFLSAEPNARLIAAAPELLAALKALVDANEDQLNRTGSGLNTLDAYAAIKKAEGKS